MPTQSLPPFVLNLASNGGRCGQESDVPVMNLW
jgi:hypothetical protein